MTLQVPGGIARLAVGECGLPGQVIITTRDGKSLRLDKRAGAYKLLAVPSCPAPAPAGIADLLTGSSVSKGRLSLKKAWLSGPTRRYPHGILGDQVEATRLEVLTVTGLALKFTLDGNSVFEDLWPRVVDIQGDGQDEVLVLRSRLNEGSSAALFGVVGTRLMLLAESEPIGKANRWLNPIGVADFDGDRRREIAVVITPHIGGTLTLFERRGSRLVKNHSKFGFSNHAIGSRELGMSTIIDLNGDGIPDLVVPDASRKSLRIVTFAGGRFRELRKHDYGRKIVTAIVTANFSYQVFPDVVFGLEDGTLVVLPR
ncbi:MAG: VCBS repeat-containing protein [SAR324 cluster bacterium]|nr:VCBS repeat-containing protein [SAR324 cluster bacterium]